MPVVFVLIWSTGFVVARLGMPHAPPMTFLAWRFALSAALFVLWVAAARAAWPRDRMQWMHLAVTGMLMHGGYLGGVWIGGQAGAGCRHGGPDRRAAAAADGSVDVAAGSGPPCAPRQWLGLALGLAGLLLVVYHRLAAGQAQAANLALAVLALASITVGTLYQKRWVAPCDVRTAAACSCWRPSP
jgi:drug/metabolite transporter (DMT)-like permease